MIHLVNELSSAETALATLQPILASITDDDMHLPTPCPGFDVAGLTDHLVGTITMVGDSAGVTVSDAVGDSVHARITSAATCVLDAWRARGVDGVAEFAGRVLPARLALGVLSVEMVLHGWDFAQALVRPLPIAAEHSDFVLGLARRIITPQSRITAGFDAPVAVDADAAALDRLVAFTGRVPSDRSHATDAG